jgi:hypothetical protein
MPLFSCEGFYTRDPVRRINRAMRAYTIAWMEEVREEFDYMRITLDIAIHILDWFLRNTNKHIQPRELQGYAAVSLFLVACIHERHPYPIEDFEWICDKYYTLKRLNQFVNQLMKDVPIEHLTAVTPWRYIYDSNKRDTVTAWTLNLLVRSRYPWTQYEKVGKFVCWLTDSYKESSETKHVVQPQYINMYQIIVSKGGSPKYIREKETKWIELNSWKNLVEEHFHLCTKSELKENEKP